MKAIDIIVTAGAILIVGIWVASAMAQDYPGYPGPYGPARPILPPNPEPYWGRGFERDFFDYQRPGYRNWAPYPRNYPDPYRGYLGRPYPRERWGW